MIPTVSMCQTHTIGCVLTAAKMATLRTLVRIDFWPLKATGRKDGGVNDQTTNQKPSTPSASSKEEPQFEAPKNNLESSGLVGYPNEEPSGEPGSSNWEMQDSSAIRVSN
ncbi:hypothetical protein HAX54_029300 [Datura stramonium]|uniref:Uncharacterized protein n=1 Tax=Datura stramonium TaxID=4076 RepID=A0ABS8V6I6_DATST|nr:hypothetical protein [Datura stramonium]